MVTFSSGNHAQAVALVGKLLGTPTVIVMPNDAPASATAGDARLWRGSGVVRPRRAEARGNCAATGRGTRPGR
ncbi:MAG: hypothetical protein MZV63_28780 [Marinilabiliales bacterium]|nr:hypothetical protein [Marinilabiliales bacterium]